MSEQDALNTFFVLDEQDALHSVYALKAVSRPSTDQKLWGLGSAHAVLGPKAVEAIKLGLSRQVSSDAEDARSLISQWEERDETCCFQGTAEDLMSLTDTMVLAISYKHEPKSCWDRHGPSKITKMSHADQDALVNVVIGLSDPEVKYVIFWCDQVISTRLKGGKENSMGWYNAGLLPYACLRVLKLSAYIPADILESRIWIKAERSLGRLGYGYVDAVEAAIGFVGEHGQGFCFLNVFQYLATMILSGYWPADTGYWAKDYLNMKNWALGVMCNSKWYEEPPIFDAIKPADNLNILSNMRDFAVVPRGLEDDERPVYIEDRTFYLKATAWNLYVNDIWDSEFDSVSHYMGDMGPFCKFSWWINETSDTIFGYLILDKRATVIIAVKADAGFMVYRQAALPEFYVHAEPRAPSSVVNAVGEAARKCGLSVNLDKMWSLLYSSCESPDNVETDPVLEDEIGQNRTYIDARPALVYIGMTTKLYNCAVSKQGDGSAKAVAKQLLHIRDRWNRHVLDNYENTLSLSDTRSGVVWLEGFSERVVSFGFYDFLTRALILGESDLPSAEFILPAKWEFVQEVRRVAKCSPIDVQIRATELYRGITEENCEELVDIRDVAVFMASSGFRSGMDANNLSMVLQKLALRRGYWSTNIFSKEGKMQIFFQNAKGEVTDVTEFYARGLVGPSDTESLRRISLPVDEEPDIYNWVFYWKSMDVNTSQQCLHETFQDSNYVLEDGRSVSMVDMTLIRDAECSIASICPKTAAASEELAKQRRDLEDVAGPSMVGKPISIEKVYMTKQQEVLGCDTENHAFERAYQESMAELNKVQREMAEFSREAIQMARNTGKKREQSKH